MHIKKIYKNEAAVAGNWAQVPAREKDNFFAKLREIGEKLDLGIYDISWDGVKAGESDTVLIIDDGPEDPDYGGQTRDYCNKVLRQLKKELAAAGFGEKEFGYHLLIEYLRGEESQDIYMDVDTSKINPGSSPRVFADALVQALKGAGVPHTEKAATIANWISSYGSRTRAGWWDKGSITESRLNRIVLDIRKQLEKTFKMDGVRITPEYSPNEWAGARIAGKPTIFVSMD